jgi:hypothetical protein
MSESLGVINKYAFGALAIKLVSRSKSALKRNIELFKLNVIIELWKTGGV